MIYFSNMCYGVYYYVVKFQLKTLAMDGEMKRTNYIRGRMNQIIVYGVIQTLAIVVEVN